MLCNCKELLNGSGIKNPECPKSAIYHCLGNAISSSQSDERKSFINKMRHLMHDYWTWCFCNDNDWPVTSDMKLDNSIYTPDRVIKNGDKVIIYDYTVTVNVERSYQSKFAKYNNLCDNFILIPFIVNGNTAFYIESLGLNYGKQCKTFSDFVDSLMPFSNYWLVTTDDFEETRMDYWHPIFESRNSFVQIRLPNINQRTINQWQQNIEILYDDHFYDIHANYNNTKLIIRDVDYGRKGQEWKDIFNNNRMEFLYITTYKTVIETYEDDQYITNPVPIGWIHQQIQSTYMCYMSRSIICTDVPFISSRDVYTMLQQGGDHLLTNKYSNPDVMLHDHYNELRCSGTFHPKECFMVPVPGDLAIEQFNYYGHHLKYNPKIVRTTEDDLHQVAEKMKEMLELNEKIKSVRMIMTQSEEGNREMYDVYNDGNPVSEDGMLLKRLLAEVKNAKANLTRLERKTYKGNMFNADQQIQHNIKAELEKHEANINLLNKSGGEYVTNTIANILSFLFRCHFNDNYQPISIPILEPLNSWWSIINKWDAEMNAMIGDISQYNLIYVCSNIQQLIKSVIAMSDYKSSNKHAIFYDVPSHKKWCLLVYNNSKGLPAGSSKPFSLITSTTGLQWYNYDTGRNEVVSNTVRYHWRYLKTDQLYFYSNIVDHVIMSYACMKVEKVIDSPFDDLFQKFILIVLDGRRKTESFLHDMKYLIFNLMGTYTDFNELILDKFIQPNNVVMAYFEQLLVENSHKFIESVEDNYNSLISTNSYNSNWLFHPLSNSPCSLDKFSYYNYLSYASIKGVFTKKMEDITNLNGILKNHKELLKLGSHINYDDFRSLFQNGQNQDNMLYYDHGVIMAISEYMLEHFRMSNHTPLSYRWYQIDNDVLSSIATSSGMRLQDNIKKGELGGNGHMIIMKTIKERWSDIDNQTFLGDYKKDHALMYSHNILLKDVSDVNGELECLFTYANKKQWGGSREIYIQTMEMKSIQYRLEKMFAEMCKSLDNELIHIPSNYRAKYIYNHIKTPSIGYRYYLTLDCKRWAPLCNMSKYIDFINAWKNYLPQSFINLFNFYMFKYFNKKLIISQEQYQQYIAKYPDDEEIFESYGTNTYAVTMPESFMMGMFNYLSSFVHASVQKYFIDNILPLIADKYHVVLKMVMFAHSDDSGGWIEIKTEKNAEFRKTVLKEVVDSYQNLLKLTNHHLSTKKCVVSEYYFEIISIIFICTDIMPTVAKNVYSFSPSAEKSGVINDLESTSSAMFEMMSNGSSLEASYLKRQFLCHAILRSCNVPDKLMTKSVTCRLGGFPSSHPLFLILYGEFAEEAWWYMTNKRLTAMSLHASGKGTNTKIITYINPDPRFYQTLKEINSFFINIHDETLYDIHDMFKITHCYQYMIKMKSLAASGNLNKVFGNVFETPLNFIKRMNQAHQYYKIANRVIKYESLPSVAMASIEAAPLIENNEILNSLFAMKLPDASEYQTDYTRVKPVSIHINDLDPLQWIKRNQLFLLWKKVNYKYYLCISTFDLDQILKGIPMDTNLFNYINITEGSKEQHYELQMKPIRAREVNNLNELVNLMLNNDYKGLGIEFKERLNCKLKHDPVSELIKEIIFNKIPLSDINRITIDNYNLQSWLIQQKAITNFNQLGYPILYRTSNQKKEYDTFEWLGKTTLYIAYKGTTTILDVRNTMVTSIMTSMQNNEIINIIRDMLPNSGYHFQFKLTYGKFNQKGFYVSKTGNIYYSDFSNGDPIIDKIYVKTNLPRIFSTQPWPYGVSNINKVIASYEIMTYAVFQTSLKVYYNGTRTYYNAEGRSRLLSMPNSFNVNNLQNWYLNSHLYHAIYKKKDEMFLSNPDAFKLSYYTITDRSCDPSYLVNEINMYESHKCDIVLKALNQVVKINGNQRSLRLKYDPTLKNYHTELINLSLFGHHFFNDAGSRCMDRTLINSDKNSLLSLFIEEIIDDYELVQRLYYEFMTIMNILLHSTHYHPIRWKTLYIACQKIANKCNEDYKSYFSDPDVSYIMLKNALFFHSNMSVEDVRTMRRSWIQTVKRTFLTYIPKLQSVSLNFYYYPPTRDSYRFLPYPEDLIDFQEVQDMVEFRIDEEIEKAEECGDDLDDDQLNQLSVRLYSVHCKKGNFYEHYEQLDPKLNIYCDDLIVDPEVGDYMDFLDRFAKVNLFGSVVPMSDDDQLIKFKNIKSKLITRNTDMDNLCAYLTSSFILGSINDKTLESVLQSINKLDQLKSIQEEIYLYNTLFKNRDDCNVFNVVYNTIASSDPDTNKYHVVNTLTSYTTINHDPMMLAELKAISPKLLKWWLNNSLILTQDQYNTWMLFLKFPPPTLSTELKDLFMKILNEFHIVQASTLTSACNSELNTIMSAMIPKVPQQDEELTAPKMMLDSSLYY